MQGIQSRAIGIALSCLLGAPACATQVSSDRPADSDIRAVAGSVGTGVEAVAPGNQDSLLQRTFGVWEELGRTRERVLASLGRPKRSLSTPVSNVHVAGRTDTVVTLRFERLTFGFWVSGAGTEQEILFDVSMHPPWPLPVYVPQSAGRADLVERWGKPAFVRSVGDTVVLNWSVWELDAEEYLQAYLVGNSIRKLRWSFYID